MAQTQNRLSKKNIANLTAVCVFLLPMLVRAVQDTTLITKPKSGESDLSLETGFEFSQSISRGEKSKREQLMEITIAPAYRINENLKLSVKTAFSQENTGSQETQVFDVLVKLSMSGFKLSPTITTIHSVMGVIPVSEHSRKRDRLQGAIGVSSGLRYITSVLDITYSVGYIQNFHEFDINANSSPNIQHGLANGLSIKLSLSENIYLSTSGVYRLAQTYGGKNRSLFEIHSDINWDVMSNLTLNLGTSNAGQALKADGVTSNISAFSENTSVLRAGISMSL